MAQTKFSSILASRSNMWGMHWHLRCHQEACEPYWSHNNRSERSDLSVHTYVIKKVFAVFNGWWVGHIDYGDRNQRYEATKWQIYRWKVVSCRWRCLACVCFTYRRAPCGAKNATSVVDNIKECPAKMVCIYHGHIWKFLKGWGIFDSSQAGNEDPKMIEQVTASSPMRWLSLVSTVQQWNRWR